MGGGTPGAGDAFYMSHQNATKLSSPSGVAGSPWDRCVRARRVFPLQPLCAAC